MRVTHFLICFLLSTFAVATLAFERPFPPVAKRGMMSPAIYPAVVIDGTTRSLAAGARIWNTDNLIEMPAALRGSDFVVNYTENGQGEIDRIWLLSADEARQPAPTSQPSH
jgi:hypothetical protein